MYLHHLQRFSSYVQESYKINQINNIKIYKGKNKLNPRTGHENP